METATATAYGNGYGMLEIRNKATKQVVANSQTRRTTSQPWIN